MRGARFDTREAAYLSRAAARRQLVTYGEFAHEFGGIAHGQGPNLTAMGDRLKKEGLPLLPVLVVNKETKLPSPDASFYARLGLGGEAALRKEQQRCFDFDWTTQPFWTDAT